MTQGVPNRLNENSVDERLENGAADRKNLEPETANLILAELEKWGRFLSSDPEIIHTLESLDQTRDLEAAEENAAPVRTRSRPGPSL